MAQKQLTLPGTVVKKHNEIIRAKINLDSSQGSKMLASLIACIQTDDANFKETYSIPVKDFLPDTGGGNYRQLKAACRALAQATVEFESFMPGDDEPRFVVIPFFSTVEYHKGVVNAKFNRAQRLKNCLLALRAHFTKYNLIEYLRLPSVYSQRIFEILKSWAITDPVKVIQLDDLHHMLNTPDSFKANFKDFRLRVLEKANKDINGKTDLTFAWEPVKRGKAVVAIRFIFSPRLQFTSAAKAKETKQAKQSAANNKHYALAVRCAQAKAGICIKQDNKRLVCQICTTQKICDDPTIIKSTRNCGGDL